MHNKIALLGLRKAKALRSYHRSASCLILLKATAFIQADRSQTGDHQSLRICTELKMVIVGDIKSADCATLLLWKDHT